MSAQQVYILGHSLGAARAWLYAWSRIKRGLRVDGVYALASPNPGDSSIGATMETHQSAHGLIARNLLNGRDFVGDVPVDLKMLGEEYVQPWKFTEICETPPMPRKFAAWHSIALYQAGAHKLFPSGGVVEIGQAADIIARLYQTADGWDWINPVDGAYCAVQGTAAGAKCAIFRGSITPLDWLDDFDAIQINVLGSRVSRGFWSGVAAAQDVLDAQLS